jgi:hypothetical protein
VSARRRDLNTDAGIAASLDKVFGAGGWTYDPHQDVWLAPGPRSALGCMFYILCRGGWWDEIIVPAESVQ